MTMETVEAEGYDDPLRILQAELVRTEAILVELENPGVNPLGSALTHLASCRGKLLRPLLTLASGYAAGCAHSREAIDRCVQAAAAVEMLHVGTLCHDDVMDEAESRRGAASINAKWGNAVAILSGDVLIARSISTVARLGPAETRVLAQTLEDLCQGQTMETASLFDSSRTRADYLRCIELKTASLFAASSQLGALAAGSDLQRSLEFAAFGRTLGVAFQVVDDVLDLVGSEELLGKPPGSDLREGVFTLPAIEALQRSPHLRELVDSMPSPEQAKEIQSIILASGAVESALAEVRTYMGEACQTLSNASGVEMRYVAPLTGLAESVLERGLVGAHAAMPGPLLDVVRQWRADTLTPSGVRPRGGHR